MSLPARSFQAYEGETMRSIQQKNRDPIKTILALLPGLVLLPSIATAQAQAPLRAEVSPQWERWEPNPVSATPITGDAEVRLGDMVLTTGGAAIGFGVALLAAGAVLGSNHDGISPDRQDIGTAGVILIAGGTAATSLGAHLGNRSRGDLLLTALGTGAALTGTTALLARADEPASVLYVSVPALTIGTAAIIQLITTR